MSAAAVSVKILNHCLAKYGVSDPRLTDKFFSAQARFQRTPWLFAAADDLRFPDALGNFTLAMRLFNWYRPMVARCPSQGVGKRFGEVTQFVQPLSSLFAPRLVSRLLLTAIWQRTRRVGLASSHAVPLLPPGAQY